MGARCINMKFSASIRSSRTFRQVQTMSMYRRDLFAGHSRSENIRVERSRIVFAEEHSEMANHRSRFGYFWFRFAMALTISAFLRQRESLLKQDRNKTAGTRRFAPLLEPFTSSASLYLAFHFFKLKHWYCNSDANKIFPELPVLSRTAMISKYMKRDRI